MSGAWHGGKGDRIPGANDKAFQENYPAIDWTAREVEERRKASLAAAFGDTSGHPIHGRELRFVIAVQATTEGEERVSGLIDATLRQLEGQHKPGSRAESNANGVSVTAEIVGYEQSWVHFDGTVERDP